MAGSIVKKLRQMASRVVLDDPPKGVDSLGETLKWMAVDAIMQGPESKAWEDYMKMFGPTPDELLRLTLKDNMQGDKEIRMDCAYIVANAVCGTGTGTQTHKLVTPLIDEGL